MYVDFGSRNSGKTTRLVEWLKEDIKGRLILIPTMGAFGYTRQIALNLGLSLEEIEEHIRPLDELIYGRLRGYKNKEDIIREIRIDEIGYLLNRLDHRINGFTVSREK